MARIRLPHNFIPRAYQQRYFDWYDHGGRNGVWVWHRRAGKDLTGLHQTAKMAIQQLGIYWHCLPTYSQGRKAVWNNFTSDGQRLMRAVFPKEIVKFPREFKPQAEMIVELTNGSMVQIIGSDAIDNIVGTNPRHVTFSEYALCRPNSYDLVRPILRANGGTSSFISTVRGKNHLWKQYEISKKTKGWYGEIQNVRDTLLKFPSASDDGVLIDAETMMAEELVAGMAPELVRQEYLCDWDAALVGSVYGDLLEVLIKGGRVTEFGHDGDQAFTFWDLGMNDSTSIWVMAIEGMRLKVVGHIENHGKPLSYYSDEVEKIGDDLHLTFRKHWIPHDAAQVPLAAGTSIEAQLRERFGAGMIEVVPKYPVLDGIQACRWLLQQDIWIHSRCGIGIEAIKQYHYEFDEKRRTFTNRPEHDWSSHCADAARYMAIVIRHVMKLANRPKVEAPPPVEEVIKTMGMKVTLNELWDQHKRDLLARNHRRIG